MEVKRVVQMFLDQMIEELALGNRLEFRDFGVLETKARAPRVAQNPKTLQRVNVPAKRTVKFKVGRLLKDRLDCPPAIVIAPGIRPDGKMGGKVKGAAGRSTEAGG